MPFADFRRKYLRNRRAAEYLGVSESFLNKRRVTGEPPAFFKIGKVVAYSLGELDRFVRTCRRRSTTDQPDRRHSISAVDNAERYHSQHSFERFPGALRDSDLDRFFAEIAAAPTRADAEDIFAGADWVFVQMPSKVREGVYAQIADLIAEKPSD